MKQLKIVNILLVHNISHKPTGPYFTTKVCQLFSTGKQVFEEGCDCGVSNNYIRVMYTV